MDERIVRVGTHRADGRLLRRNRHHYAGNRRGSVFRRHLGAAVLARDDPSDPRITEWIKQRGVLMPEVGVLVKLALNDHFKFRCVRVDSLCERLALEAGLIALLAQQPLGPPSTNWLGHRALQPEIRQSGLWNRQHVNRTPLTPEQIEQLIAFVDAAGSAEH